MHGGVRAVYSEWYCDHMANTWIVNLQHLRRSYKRPAATLTEKDVSQRCDAAGNPVENRVPVRLRAILIRKMMQLCGVVRYVETTEL